ncbi:HNH endonuclease [Cronobacter dublinensis]|nr:HNH endonuclease [Cronobacter dublinensis]
MASSSGYRIQDTGYMQLVPTELHDAVRHSGGIATNR